MLRTYGLRYVVNVARVNNIALTKNAIFSIYVFLVMYCILENFTVFVWFCVFVFCFASCFFRFFVLKQKNIYWKLVFKNL